MTGDTSMKTYQKIGHALLLYLVFIFYIFILFTLLFLKGHAFRSVNLIPFHTIKGYLFGSGIFTHNFALTNLLGNIVLFVPLGVYVTLFNRNKGFLKNIILIILMSTCVEVIQYIFKLGVSDVDDVILNGLGGFIGIVFYKTLLIMLKDIQKVRYTIEIMAPIIGFVSIYIIYLRFLA
jgi:glycopeptide antibiotics resistance protein